MVPGNAVPLAPAGIPRLCVCTSTAIDCHAPPGPIGIRAAPKSRQRGRGPRSAVSEVISIFPITPASPMAEHCDDWAAAGKTEPLGQGSGRGRDAVRGRRRRRDARRTPEGRLSTTFTASQGLLLMIPNMFKIAGELTPAVIHVAARTLATHALSIFGDHSDVMHARATGWAMLCAGSVQEAHDFALIAHASTLRARLPFLHFFDGFRTSHEVNKIDLSSSTTSERSSAKRTCSPSDAAGLTPRPRSCAAPPRTPTSSSRPARPPTRTTWPSRASSRRSWTSSPREPAERYGLVDYHGAPDAERVVVVMGSAAGAVEETVEELVAAGEKVGVAQDPALPALPDRGTDGRACRDREDDRRPRPDQGAGRRRRAALPRSRCRSHRGHGRRQAAVRDHAACHRRPLRPLVQGSHARR
jgi:pyruvate/2-oxoacid:ferredoxin oxidoreductase alpha subunit